MQRMFSSQQFARLTLFVRTPNAAEDYLKYCFL